MFRVKRRRCVGCLARLVPKRQPRQKVKNDPRIFAAARELRDRWLEQVNGDPSALAITGKYNVSKAIAAQQAGAGAVKLLESASLLAA